MYVVHLSKGKQGTHLVITVNQISDKIMISAPRILTPQTMQRPSRLSPPDLLKHTKILVILKQHYNFMMILFKSFGGK